MKKKLIVTILCIALAAASGCRNSSNNSSDTEKSSSDISTNSSTVQKVEEELGSSYKNFSVSDGYTDECKFLYISTTSENDTEDFGSSISFLAYKTWFDYDYVLVTYTVNDSAISSILWDVSTNNVYLSTWNNPISSESSDAENKSQSTTPEETTPEETTPEETAPSILSYSSNQYKVGVDIPAGEYVLIGDGYFSVTSDANGSDIIFNNMFENNFIVTLNDGEYFTLDDATAYPFEQYCASHTIDTTKSNCMLKIGVNLPAGEYKLNSVNDNAYYCIYSSSRCDDIISNNIFDSSSYITVSDGQYLLINDCTIQQ